MRSFGQAVNSLSHLQPIVGRFSVLEDRRESATPSKSVTGFANVTTPFQWKLALES
jgi:hypothetical protein